MSEQLAQGEALQHGVGAEVGGPSPTWSSKALASLRAAYDVVLGQPMEEGRLSFTGAAGVSRAIAAGGLIALIAMLVSIVFNESWRAGSLENVGSAAFPAVVPQALVPVTFVALFVAWLLIAWGAFGSVLWVRLAAASVFAFLNAVIAHPQVLAVNSSLAIRWSPALAIWAYCAVPALIVLGPALRRWPALDRYARPAALSVLTLSTACFFAADLWAQMGQVAAGAPLTVPTQLNAVLINLDALLFPMVFVSVLAIVELSYGVTEAVSGPFWSLSPRVAKLCLGAFLAFALWRQIVSRADAWYLFIRVREGAAVRTLGGLALLGALALGARWYRPRAKASEAMRERVVYSASSLLALPVLVALAVYGFQQCVDSNFPDLGGSLFDLPSNWTSLSSPVFWGLALVGATSMLVRPNKRQTPSREAAIGLAMVGAWAEFFFVPEAFGHEWGFDPSLFEAGLTVCVGIYALARSRTMSARTAVWLGALVGFGWLVSTEGDVISLIGRFVGLPGTLLLAAGLAYSLLVDSEFTRKSSRALPAGARPLLWVGYLLLSATIANWVLATHGPKAFTIDEQTVKAFQFIGLPVAAWFLSWRPFARVEAFEEDEGA